MYLHLTPWWQLFIPSPTLPRTSPSFNRTTDAMLGSGHFGGVQVAVWNGPKGKCEVAIKTLNPSSIKPEDKIKFLQEAAIMSQFKHPNVIQLYGIVTDGEQVEIQCGTRCRREVRRDNIHALSLKGEQVRIGCRICIDLYTNSLRPPPPPPNR